MWEDFWSCMQRQTLMVLAAALALRAATGLAQDGALAGVTMRVVDDISALDVVILELDADSGEDGEAAEANVREADAASVNDAGMDARGRATQGAVTEADAAADRRDPAALDDGDVERPTAPPTPVP